MKCPFDGKDCDKPKILSTVEIVNGEKKEMSVCSNCIHKVSEKHKNVFQLLQSIPFNLPYSDDLLEDYVCKCGMTLFQLSKNGRLGCTECYDTFGSIILPIVEKNCKSLQHVGKFPKRLKKIADKREAELLEKEMKEVIGREDYERAAKIRDRLKELRGTNGEEENKVS